MLLSSGDVAIRSFSPGDRHCLVAIADNRRVAKWLAERFPNPYRLEDADSWIASTREEKRPCNFAIDWQGRLVGGIGLLPLTDIHSGTAEVGYWLGEPYWGKGLASRALGLLVTYAFDELLFIRLQAHVFAPNTASMRVLEKAGFLREGLLRKHIRKNGEIFDAVLYARLRNP